MRDAFLAFASASAALALLAAFTWLVSRYQNSQRGLAPGEEEAHAAWRGYLADEAGARPPAPEPEEAFWPEDPRFRDEGLRRQLAEAAGSQPDARTPRVALDTAGADGALAGLRAKLDAAMAPHATGLHPEDHGYQEREPDPDWWDGPGRDGVSPEPPKPPGPQGRLASAAGPEAGAGLPDGADPGPLARALAALDGFQWNAPEPDENYYLRPGYGYHDQTGSFAAICEEDA